MGEFANTIREQAADALRRMYQRESPRGTDPLIELVAFLLEDGTDDSTMHPGDLVTTEQWVRWHRLVAERPRAVRRTLTNVLDRERPTLPTDKQAMRMWAVNLLLSTLDRMEAV